MPEYSDRRLITKVHRVYRQRNLMTKGWKLPSRPSDNEGLKHYVLLYQSIVSFKPSIKSFLALNPNSFSAFETFKTRRSCPSGFDESQMISPVKPTASAMTFTKSRTKIS